MISVLMFWFTYISGFVLTFRNLPIFAFVLYETVYFFYPQNRWWASMVPDISYSFFVVLLMLFTLVMNHSQFKQSKILAIPQLRWAWLVMALYGIAYFYAVLPDFHYDAWFNFFKLLIIISVAFKLCVSDKALNYMLYGYILGAWYISFYAYQIGRNSGERVERIGTVDSPDANGMAAAIAPSLVLCLYYYWIHKSKWAKAAFAVAGVFVANAIVLINSRGAFLAVALSILVFMYYMYTSSFQRKHQKATAVFLTIAGLSGGLYLADDGFIERMYTITEEAEVDETKESGSTRMIFWGAAVDMAEDFPFGAGYRGFNYYADRYIPEGIDTGGKVNRTVHSTWFEALSEVGYLGLFAFVMMLYACALTTQRCKKALKARGQVDEYFKVIAIQASLLAFMVAMTFLNRLRAEILYWCVLYTASAYQIYVLHYSNTQSEQKTTEAAAA